MNERYEGNRVLSTQQGYIAINLASFETAHTFILALCALPISVDFWNDISVEEPDAKLRSVSRVLTYEFVLDLLSSCRMQFLREIDSSQFSINEDCRDNLGSTSIARHTRWMELRDESNVDTAEDARDSNWDADV